MAAVIRLQFKRVPQRSILVVILTLLVLPCWAREKPLSSVADLRYGVVLYDYYQGNFLGSLSELMVAEQRGGIHGHGDNPKLIEGGISLSFGMERKAGEIFNELLAPDETGQYTRSLETRNAAWYYLGQLRYLRGDWDGTEESFSHIDGKFDTELLPELESLAINLSIRRNDLQLASSQLESVRNNQEWLPFLYFNMGNAYARNQNYSEALKYFQRLEKMPRARDFEQLSPRLRNEQLALYDKALTSAGYTYILQKQPQQAIAQFAKIRLDSPLANRALLGYGWAAVESNNYSLALKPWQELSRRSLVYDSVQESLIAVPYAYEQLGARGQALQSYVSAESAFEQEIVRIDDVINNLEQLDLLSALNIEDTDNRNWFLMDEDNSVEPSLTYLTQLFSLNEFQSSIQELRDLIDMQDQLANWKEKIDAYNYMLEVREFNRVEQMEAIAAKNLNQQLLQMHAKRQQLNDALEKIISEKDYLALADKEELELYEIVQEVEKNVNALNRAGEGDEEYDEGLRRYKGLLYWQASEASHQRQWQVRNAINKLDSVIAETQTNLDRLNKVIVEAPDITPYRQNIYALSQRLAQQKASVDAVVKTTEDKLRGDVLVTLESQKNRLRHYLSQARLSVARLYDDAVNAGVVKKPEAEQGAAP